MTSIVAWAGQSAPGAAVHSGSAVSAALNFTTGLRTFQASRRVAVVVRDLGRAGSARRFGSALQRIVRARMNVPSSSVTPSPGMISATGTPAASVAPASCAASAIAKLIIPMPPLT